MLPVRNVPESRTVITGSITSIRRAEIPEHGLHLELLWDAALLESLPEHISRPDIEAPLWLQLRLSPDGHLVIMDGSCESQGMSTCVRCLERFPHPLNLIFRCVFQPIGMNDANGTIELGPDDLEMAYYDGEHIDLVAPVFEQIHLGLPAYPHCSEECRGLCAQCGANLNNGACGCETGPRTQSPFAALGKLKKKA